jgi:hypothetical protein
MLFLKTTFFYKNLIIKILTSVKHEIPEFRYAFKN